MMEINLNELGYQETKCYCPECKELVTMLPDRNVPCEDCGEHKATECDNCGELFDSVWGWDMIEGYNEERLK
jgi:methionyl-tRNA synthetase